MRRSLSDRVERPGPAGRGWMLPSWALLALGLAAPLGAQDDAGAAAADGQDTVASADAALDSVVGAAVSVGGRSAALDLELSDGRTVQLEVADGRVTADGETIGRYEENDVLERSWRDLLEEAAMLSTAELPSLLRRWQPPAAAGDVGERLDRRLEQALAGVGGRMVERSPRAAPAEDSIDKLLARIEDLEERRGRDRVIVENRWDTPEFLDDFLHGLGSLFGTLVWFGVLFGIGSAMLFFGDGRVERLAGTVREEPVRAALIGLAGAFLSIPFYVLVMLALVISIIGIPLVIAWAPLFPMLMALAGIAGWLAVAYAAGEAVVRRKLSGRPLFREPGMFQNLAVGILLLLSPFILGSLFLMTSVLDWLGDLLFLIGMLTNVLMTAIGLGAVLVRGRAGLERHRERRAAEKRARTEASATEEGTHV